MVASETSLIMTDIRNVLPLHHLLLLLPGPADLEVAEEGQALDQGPQGGVAAV